MLLEFVDRSGELLISNPSNDPDAPRYSGETWGVSVGDVDRDGVLDLYVNHHTLEPAELIYGFAGDNPQHAFIHIPSDKYDAHAATFFDINQDGKTDLLEARGGARGTVTDPDDERVWNQVYLNVDGNIIVDNVADLLGVEYGQARGRSFTPINFDGEWLGMFYGTRPKDDGSDPSVLFRMSPDGTFAPSLVLHGDLTFEEFGIGAHLGANGMVDVITVSDRSATPVQVTVQFDAADGVHSNDVAEIVVDDGYRVGDIQVADFNGDLEMDLYVGLGGPGGVSDRLYTFGSDNQPINLTPGSGLEEDVFNTMSATAGDFDNDGDVDIAALHEGPGIDITFFMNDGEGNFTLDHYIDPTDPGKADEIISGDFDNDGWIDFLVTTGAGVVGKEVGQYTLLEQVPRNDNHWIKISLEGVTSEKDGLGARVYVTTKSGQQVQEQDSGLHVAVQDSQVLHFGLGSENAIDRIVVVWPDGHEQVVQQVAVDQHIVIVEDNGEDYLAGTQPLPHALNETLVGGDGPDLLAGRQGADVVRGNLGDDTLFGGDGRDRLGGGGGDDLVKGGRGDDTMFGGADNDRLAGSTGADLVKGGDGDDRVFGGNGDDTLAGNAGADRVRGGDGDDRLFGGDGDDTLAGNARADRVKGGDGDDTLSGGDGDDTLAGNAGADRVRGGDGDDRLFGGDGDDTLAGQGGSDILFGGRGRDVLFGGNGSDTLIGGRSNDILTGGGGQDSFVFAPGFGHDTVRDFLDDADTLDLSRFEFATVNDALASASHSGTDVLFEIGTDSLVVQNASLDQLGDDILL